jgi:hypothetical protein
MRMLWKLLLGGLTAALLFAGLVGAASANRLSLSERGLRWNFRPLTFSSTSGGESVSCNVTLEGSFHSRTFIKQTGDPIGSVSRVALARPCTGGEATILSASLPWTVTYFSFSGTLPNITHLRLLEHGTSYRISTPFGACLMRTTPTDAAFILVNIGAGGTMTSIRMDESVEIVATGGFGCEFGQTILSGAGSVTRLGTTTALTLRLI